MILTTSLSALLITIAVSIVLPWLVAFITKESMPQNIKALILLLLATATGIVSGLLTNPPATWAQWQQVLLSIFVAFVAAASSNHFNEHTGATPAISRSTSNFGIGPSPKTVEPPPPAV